MNIGFEHIFCRDSNIQDLNIYLVNDCWNLGRKNLKGMYRFAENLHTVAGGTSVTVWTSCEAMTWGFMMEIRQQTGAVMAIYQL